MRPEDLRRLLADVASGAVDVDAAAEKLAVLPYEDLGFARIDHHRALRTGFPEVVFGPGKRPEEITQIIEAIRGRGQLALVTRLVADAAEIVLSSLSPERRAEAHYDPISRLLHAGPPIEVRGRGVIGVVSAGTSDRPVAEEAARTAELMGNEVRRIRDVGVAGLHRILAQRDAMESCEVLIVVAGMEGALPSVVAGLISKVIIAVPTSVGVGASFGGISALLSMINACAPGVVVVNIDNGFAAGYAAAVINRKRESGTP